MTLTFDLQQAAVMSHIQAKKSRSKVTWPKRHRVETDGRLNRHDQLQYLVRYRNVVDN